MQSIDSKPDLPIVSVVVCTYNRKDFLRKCLRTILESEFPATDFEVIVIDGGSSDGTLELPKSFPKARFFVESKHGLAFARNKGAELARGEIVAYTDDDCIVDKEWLKRIVEVFSLFRIAACACGPVHPLEIEAIPKELRIGAALGLFDGGDTIKQVDGLVTSNAAFRRDVLCTVRFNENLGVTRRAGLLFSGEDDLMAQDLAAAGQKILYTPYAKVYHHVPRERLSVRYILKHALHGGISQAKIMTEKGYSRIRCMRHSLSNFIQNSLGVKGNPSLANLYSTLYYFSTLVTIVTFLDHAVGALAKRAASQGRSP